MAQMHVSAGDRRVGDQLLDRLERAAGLHVARVTDVGKRRDVALGGRRKAPRVMETPDLLHGRRRPLIRGVGQNRNQGDGGHDPHVLRHQHGEGRPPVLGRQLTALPQCSHDDGRRRHGKGEAEDRPEAESDEQDHADRGRGENDDDGEKDCRDVHGHCVRAEALEASPLVAAVKRRGGESVVQDGVIE